jgi:hypothetical protein
LLTRAVAHASQAAQRQDPGGSASVASTTLEETRSEPGAQHAGHPRFSYELDYFALLTATLRPEVIGDTPDGYRVNFYITGGSVQGPNIDAKVRAEGGDWMCIRPDGTGIVDINVTYETADGALILDQAGGVFQLGVEGLARLKRGVVSGAPPFYATPRWLTDAPAWRWLNAQQGFGFGVVSMEEMLVHCDMYIPRVVGVRST